MYLSIVIGNPRILIRSRGNMRKNIGIAKENIGEDILYMLRHCKKLELLLRNFKGAHSK
jgi:hypothetical protein